MKIPFGKFRGAFLCDLPDDYLEWLLIIELREPLRSAVFSEADARRFKTKYEDNNNAPRAAMVDELVSAGLRTLALKYHPDRGGNPEKMVAINTAVDWVKLQVRMLL